MKETIEKDTLVKNVVKIIKQLCETLIICYILGCFWYRICWRLNPPDTSSTFISNYGLTELDTFD